MAKSASSASKKSEKTTTSQRHSFSAEVDRVLEIVTHALYQHRNIFLRELLSNAADAYDKRRFLGLTSPSLLAEQSEEPSIFIKIDKENKTLTVSDEGIGMSLTEMQENLGTIAHSGTKKFLESAQKEDASQKSGQEKTDLPQLIGQFGMGFYASFMVASKVTVISRKAGTTTAALWQSDGRNGYSVEALNEADAATTPVGTQVILLLKNDSLEFCDNETISKTVHTYARHIGLKIILSSDKEEKQVLQEGDALWRRAQSDVTADDLNDFYRAHIEPFGSPWASIHKTLEGLRRYTMMLFIPSQRPFDLFSQEFKSGIKLYVQRVFITDGLEGILPGYLRFVRGIIETDDMPLNVSREAVQDSPVIAMMKKGVTTRILSLLREKSEKEPEAYQQFWQTFGAVLKEGLYAHDGDHETLFKLARFRSTHNPEQWTSLEEYIERMKDSQNTIYTITAETTEQALASPQLEGYIQKGQEVLLLTDPIDSFWVATRSNFQGKSFVSVTSADTSPEKEATSTTNKDEKEEETTTDDASKAMSAFEPLCKIMHGFLENNVVEVRLSHRLTKSPVCLVALGQGLDIHMERLMKTQGNNALKQSPRHILEINPEHPLIKALKVKVEDEKADIRDITCILFEQARLLAGENIEKPTQFVDAVNGMLEKVV